MHRRLQRVACAIATWLVVLTVAASSAHAEIYKCTGKPIPVYQNFPCEFDSLDALPSTPGGIVTTTGVTGSPLAGAGITASHPPSPTTPAVPRVGMTIGQVRAIWGEPASTSKEEPAEGDVEVWTYPGTRSIQFDHKGRATAIRW